MRAAGWFFYASTIAGGHSHAHGHEDHAHAREASRRALSIALALIVALMLGEIAFGILANSLALLADAAHLLTDAGALAFALAAAALAARPARGRWTFGFSRLEILSAQVNGVTLLLVGIWIVYSAARRLADPPEVRGGVVLVVALVGVAVNLAATVVLARGADRASLNVRGAVLHVATDLAGFAGTALAGALVLATGWDRFDPLASLLVACLVFWASVALLRDSTRIFLEVAPLDPNEIGRALVGADGVVEAHDLHVWTVGSGFPSLSAHVLVRADADCHAIRRRLEAMLAERFSIEHTTLQVDHVGAAPLLEVGPTFRRRSPLPGR